MLHLAEPTLDGSEGRILRPQILNASSDSAASARATAVAAVLARERDGDLIVVHVCPAQVLRFGRLAPTIVHDYRLDNPHASRVLSAARQVAWANGVLPRVMLISGDPAPVILSLAHELAIDLIVIGASRSRPPAVLAAPTRYRIQRHAPCPVRVVAPDPALSGPAGSCRGRGVSSR